MERKGLTMRRYLEDARIGRDGLWVHSQRFTVNSQKLVPALIDRVWSGNGERKTTASYPRILLVLIVVLGMMAIPAAALAAPPEVVVDETFSDTLSTGRPQQLAALRCGQRIRAERR
jgi:hypothetical protein